MRSETAPSASAFGGVAPGIDGRTGASLTAGAFVGAAGAIGSSTKSSGDRLTRRGLGAAAGRGTGRGTEAGALMCPMESNPCSVFDAPKGQYFQGGSPFSRPPEVPASAAGWSAV